MRVASPDRRREAGAREQRRLGRRVAAPAQLGRQRRPDPRVPGHPDHVGPGEHERRRPGGLGRPRPDPHRHRHPGPGHRPPDLVRVDPEPPEARTSGRGTPAPPAARPPSRSRRSAPSTLASSTPDASNTSTTGPPACARAGSSPTVASSAPARQRREAARRIAPSVPAHHRAAACAGLSTTRGRLRWRDHARGAGPGLGCSWSPARAGPGRRRSRPGSPWPRRGGGGGCWSPRWRGGRGWPGCSGGRALDHREARVADGVNALAIDPDESLREYLARYGFAPLARLLSWAHLNRFITAAAPGLGDVLLVGKVWEAATRAARPGRAPTTWWCWTRRRPGGWCRSCGRRRRWPSWPGSGPSGTRPTGSGTCSTTRAGPRCCSPACPRSCR